MSIHCNIYLPITLTILNNHTIYFQTLLAVDGSGVRQRSLPGITLTKWRAARKAPTEAGAKFTGYIDGRRCGLPPWLGCLAFRPVLANHGSTTGRGPVMP